MKYILLIHHGPAPTPPSAEWDALSADEKHAIAAGYRAVSEAPGATPGPRMQPPEMATTVRVSGGETLVTDGPFAEIKEAIGGYLLYEADDLDAAIELAARSRQPDSAARSRCGRWWSASDPRAGLPRPLGARARRADRLPRRLRPGRGGRAGGLRDRRRALAARRRSREPGGLAGGDGAQPGDRPHPPRSHARRQDAPAGGPPAAVERDDGRGRAHSPTSAWS